MWICGPAALGLLAGAESQDPEKDTYALDVDAAVMRLRFPLLLKQAREVFGDDVCRS